MIFGLLGQANLTQNDVLQLRKAILISASLILTLRYCDVILVVWLWIPSDTRSTVWHKHNASVESKGFLAEPLEHWTLRNGCCVGERGCLNSLMEWGLEQRGVYL
jgi:hypothetical protein